VSIKVLLHFNRGINKTTAAENPKFYIESATNREGFDAKL
jgi:hypothetical protein